MMHIFIRLLTNLLRQHSLVVVSPQWLRFGWEQDQQATNRKSLQLCREPVLIALSKTKTAAQTRCMVPDEGWPKWLAGVQRSWGYVLNRKSMSVSRVWFFKLANMPTSVCRCLPLPFIYVFSLGALTLILKLHKVMLGIENRLNGNDTKSFKARMRCLGILKKGLFRICAMEALFHILQVTWHTESYDTTGYVWMGWDWHIS